MNSPESQSGSIPASARTDRRWRSKVIVGYVAATALGLKLGWDFGNQVAGAWLGFITAINSALFCALLMSLVERLATWLADKGRRSWT